MNPSCSSLKLYARFFALHTSCQFSLYLLGASRSIARIRYLSNFVLRQICQILSYRISFVPIRIIDNWQRYDSCSILLFPPILLFHPIQRLASNFSKQKLNFLKEFSNYNIQFSLLSLSTSLTSLERRRLGHSSQSNASWTREHSRLAIYIYMFELPSGRWHLPQ